MKKKILALSLALALLAVMVPATAFASTLTKQNYVYLNFDSGDLTASERYLGMAIRQFNAVELM